MVAYTHKHTHNIKMYILASQCLWASPGYICRMWIFLSVTSDIFLPCIRLEDQF